MCFGPYVTCPIYSNVKYLLLAPGDYLLSHEEYIPPCDTQPSNIYFPFVSLFMYLLVKFVQVFVLFIGILSSPPIYMGKGNLTHVNYYMVLFSNLVIPY